MLGVFLKVQLPVCFGLRCSSPSSCSASLQRPLIELAMQFHILLLVLVASSTGIHASEDQQVSSAAANPIRKAAMVGKTGV